VCKPECIQDVFRRLKKNLKLQPDKCEFLRKEVTYLGHKISESGVEPDNRKIEAIENFPKPNTVKLKSFLGLAGYYRRFVPYFSKIAQTTKERREIRFGGGPRNCGSHSETKVSVKTPITIPRFFGGIYTYHRRVK
jgi:hypothetical protein